MSLTKLIDDLSANSANLRAAMESGKAEGIEEALVGFREAVEQIKAAGERSENPETRAKLVALMPQLDENRALASLLADMTGQRHDMIAARSRDARQPLYGRSGERYA